MHFIFRSMAALVLILALLGASVLSLWTPRPESWDYHGGDMAVLPSNNDDVVFPQTLVESPTSEAPISSTRQQEIEKVFLGAKGKRNHLNDFEDNNV